MVHAYINHSDIEKFAQNKVNLPKDNADKYRAQARRLRERLEEYLKENPDFSLKRMMLSGSLAKGSALRSLNDIDVACYVSGMGDQPNISELLDYMVDKLRTAFPNFSPDQVKPKTYSITVSFKVSGLDVDIVPILYDGDTDWYGNLISQDDGSFLKTNIPRHLDFIKKRKSKHPQHFIQVARLVKQWARKEKEERSGFRFKSFAIELILANLSDNGVDFSDYPEVMQKFFTYIIKTRMRELIVFNDYYDRSKVSMPNTPIKIIDPVNPCNNVSSLYTCLEADMIVDAAADAGDAIDSASYATTKAKAIYYWQKVFGSIFQV